MPKKAKIPGPKAPNGGKMPSASAPKRRPKAPPMPETEPMMDGMGPDALMGMAGPSDEERIRDWIENDVLAKQSTVFVLRLSQATADGKTTVREFAEDDLEGQDAGSLASLIYGHAVSDSEGFDNITRYVIEAVRSTDGKTFARCFFKIAPEDMNTGFESERGHLPEGHMAQAHRHSEVFARMMIAQSAEVMRHQREQNKEMGVIQARLFRVQVESINLFEQMKDRKMLREITMGKHHRTERLKNMAVEFVLTQAMKFAPELAHRMGLLTNEERESLTTHDSVMNWLMTMPEEDVKKLLGETKDEKQREALTKAWIAAKKKRAALEAKRALQGDSAPKQMNGAAKDDKPASTTKASTGVVDGQPGAVQKGQTLLQFNGQEMSVVNLMTLTLLGVLFDLSDSIFDMALGKMPESAHEDLRGLRGKIKEGFKPSEEQKKEIIKRFRADAIAMLVDASDSEFAMLLTQLDARAKPVIEKAREMLKAKLA